MKNSAWVNLRVTPEIKAALANAAGTPGAKGFDGRSSTLAKQFIIEKLIEKGFLPPEGEQHAEEQKP